jgi:restriction system protein
VQTQKCSTSYRLAIFERLVAELYRDHGWEVQLTAFSRDGGYDLVALHRIGPQEIKVLVEVKRFSPQRPVSVGLVRSLYGTRTLRHASQVVLATSSHVSAYAKQEFRDAIPHELSFIERDQLLEWCSAAGGYPTMGFGRR